MSQHDYVIENQTFPATRTDLNNAFGAIVSQNSGATAPSTTYAYQLWYDTTANKLKQRNADNDAWIDLFDVDQSADTASPSTGGGGTASFSLFEFTATSAQTTFSGADDNSATLSYSAGKILVMMNGITLDPSDFTATNGTSVVLAAGASSGDLVNVYAFDSFSVADTVSAASGGTFNGGITVAGDLTVDTDTLKVDSTNNRVGVNQASPSHPIHVGTSDLILDISGNLLVGKATFDSSLEGVMFDDRVFATKSDAATAIFNRLTSDGDIVLFRKDGTTVGSIGVATDGASLFISSPSGNDSGLKFQGNAVVPCVNGTGADRDNAIDLGKSASRYDDVFATNGNINTSDQNEKQQIASLTSAEITAAKAISKLFKTFKWNSAVEAKGDAARAHTGVIAQDVETAMTAAGLDAGDYAFFISGTWYVDADGNEVEADADGAIEKNRKGIRYPELLSFIGAATEQRFANIETRLTALENA